MGQRPEKQTNRKSHRRTVWSRAGRESEGVFTTSIVYFLYTSALRQVLAVLTVVLNVRRGLGLRPHLFLFSRETSNKSQQVSRVPLREYDGLLFSPISENS
jgi:hypothetical protein